MTQKPIADFDDTQRNWEPLAQDHLVQEECQPQSGTSAILKSRASASLDSAEPTKKVQRTAEEVLVERKFGGPVIDLTDD